MPRPGQVAVDLRSICRLPRPRRESCAAPAALPTSGSCSESRARWRSSLRPAAPRGAPAPSPDPVRHSESRSLAASMLRRPDRLPQVLAVHCRGRLGPSFSSLSPSPPKRSCGWPRLLGRDGPTRFPTRVLRDPALITGIVRPCEDLVAFVVPKTMHTNRRLRLCLVLSFWSLQAVTLVTHSSHCIYSPSSAEASFHVPEPWPLAWIPQNLRPLIEVFAAPQPPPRGLKSSLRSTDMLMR